MAIMRAAIHKPTRVAPSLLQREVLMSRTTVHLYKRTAVQKATISHARSKALHLPVWMRQLRRCGDSFFSDDQVSLFLRSFSSIKG